MLIMCLQGAVEDINQQEEHRSLPLCHLDHSY
jgi:hypothetical protein